MTTARHKSPAASQTIKTEIVCPTDANPMGILQGGRLIQWMDITAAACAQTHAEKACVTASINRANFYKPAQIGHLVTIKASTTRVFTTSLEIYVQAHARNVLDTAEHLITEAYFTFVALDDKSPLIPIEPATPLEVEQYNGAL